MGRKGSRRRGRPQPGKSTHHDRAWAAFLTAAQAGSGSRSANVNQALEYWRSRASLHSTLMACTTVAPRTVAAKGDALCEVQAEAGMVAAIELCRQAFENAKIKMASDFWQDDTGDAHTKAVEDMPYHAALRAHLRTIQCGGVAPRRYYVYYAAGMATAAIVVDVFDEAVWVVQIMGSLKPGDGACALGSSRHKAPPWTCSARFPAVEALVRFVSENSKTEIWLSALRFQRSYAKHSLAAAQ